MRMPALLKQLESNIKVCEDYLKTLKKKKSPAKNKKVK